MCAPWSHSESPASCWNSVVNYWDVLLLDGGKAAVFNVWLQTIELFWGQTCYFSFLITNEISNLSILLWKMLGSNSQTRFSRHPHPVCVWKTRASTWFCPSRVGICLYGFSEAPFADHLLPCLLQMWKVLGENSGGCKDPLVAAEACYLSGSLWALNLSLTERIMVSQVMYLLL